MKRVITLTLLMIFSFSFAQRLERSREKILYRDFMAKDLNTKKSTRHSSSFVYTQKMDSVVNTPYDLYDSRIKDVFHYNSNEFNDQVVNYRWDKNQNIYFENNKYEYIHDIRGNITEETYYEIVYPDGMTPLEKYERTYSSDDQLLTEVKSFFQYQGNKQWEKDQRDEYTYGTQGNLLENLHFYWDNAANQWIKRFKTEYTYNTGGSETESTTYSWDQTIQQWNKSAKYEYNYNSENLVAEFIEYQWDNTGSDWEKMMKTEYSYLTSGKISKTEAYRWDKSSNDWVHSSKMTYNYNSSGDLISTQGDLYSGVSVVSVFSEYSYNDNSDISKVLLPHAYQYMYDDAAHMLVEKKVYTGSFLKRSINDHYFYYYSKLGGLAVGDLNREKLLIFPNPVRDMMHIKSNTLIKQVEIFSILGQKIKEVKHPGQAIYTDDLSRGIYMIRIRSDEGVAVRKLIKL